jgi:hypothetical protein
MSSAAAATTIDDDATGATGARILQKHTTTNDINNQVSVTNAHNEYNIS